MSKILTPEREKERERESRKRVEPSDFSTLLSPKVGTGLDRCNFPDHILKVSDQYLYFFSKKAGFVSPKDCTNKYTVSYTHLTLPTICSV